MTDTRKKHTGPMCSENGILGYTNEEIAAMTDTKTPTLLEDLDWIADQLGRSTFPVNRLRAFHSSGLIQKLQDPKLRAAVEVFTNAFPGMLSLFEDRSEAASITFASLVENTLKTAFTEYHRASQAAQAATEKP